MVSLFWTRLIYQVPYRQLGREVVYFQFRQLKCDHISGGDDRRQGELQSNRYFASEYVLLRVKAGIPIKEGTSWCIQTLFTFTMQTPKGEKQAGVVYVEVSSMLNNKVATLANLYTLEKCPVKDSKVNISVTAELIGEGAMSDTMSVDSTIFNQSGGPSTLSIESKKFIP